MIYEVKRVHFSSKTRFGAQRDPFFIFGDFGSQKEVKFNSVSHYNLGATKIGALLAPKVLFGTTWATWGPPGAQGWLAGWLAG